MVQPLSPGVEFSCCGFDGEKNNVNVARFLVGTFMHGYARSI